MTTQPGGVKELSSLCDQTVWQVCDVIRTVESKQTLEFLLNGEKKTFLLYLSSCSGLVVHC